MTVEELIKELQELPPKAIIIQSTDEEGNSFKSTYNISVGNFSNDGEFGISELTEELKEAGYTEEDIIEGQLSVCFWPD